MLMTCLLVEKNQPILIKCQLGVEAKQGLISNLSEKQITILWCLNSPKANQKPQYKQIIRWRKK